MMNRGINRCKTGMDTTIKFAEESLRIDYRHVSLLATSSFFSDASLAGRKPFGYSTGNKTITGYLSCVPVVRARHLVLRVECDRLDVYHDGVGLSLLKHRFLSNVLRCCHLRAIF